MEVIVALVFVLILLIRGQPGVPQLEGGDSCVEVLEEEGSVRPLETGFAASLLSSQ